jgi:hypothetical protein
MKIDATTVGLGVAGIAVAGGLAYVLSTRPANAAPPQEEPPVPSGRGGKGDGWRRFLCGDDGCTDDVLNVGQIVGGWFRNKNQEG